MYSVKGDLPVPLTYNARLRVTLLKLLVLSNLTHTKSKNSLLSVTSENPARFTCLVCDILASTPAQFVTDTSARRVTVIGTGHCRFQAPALPRWGFFMRTRQVAGRSSRPVCVCFNHQSIAAISSWQLPAETETAVSIPVRSRPHGFGRALPNFSPLIRFILRMSLDVRFIDFVSLVSLFPLELTP